MGRSLCLDPRREGSIRNRLGRWRRSRILLRNIESDGVGAHRTGIDGSVSQGAEGPRRLRVSRKGLKRLRELGFPFWMAQAEAFSMEPRYFMPEENLPEKHARRVANGHS